MAVTSREAYLAYREEEDALKAIAATLSTTIGKKCLTRLLAVKSNCMPFQKKNAALKGAAAAAGDVFKDVKEATVFVTLLAK